MTCDTGGTKCLVTVVVIGINDRDGTKCLMIVIFMGTFKHDIQYRW